MFTFTKRSYFILGYFFVLVLWWVTIILSKSVGTQVNYMYGLSFSLLPLIGGVLGLCTSNEWGFLKSLFGKSIFFISLGLITWSLGGVIWSYYNLVLNIEVPYPSIADLAYVISWPLWSIGVFFLSKATGAKFGFKNAFGKLTVLISILVSLSLTYFLIVQLANKGQWDFSGGFSQILFSFAYPLGDIVILALALVIYGLSFKYLGGKYRLPISLLLFGFILNYISDMAFSYTTAAETFYTGSWVDLLFTITFFVLSFSLNSISIVRNKDV